MKRSFSFWSPFGAQTGLVTAGLAFIAATYGLVRFAYGLYLPDMQTDLGFDAVTAGVISAGASVMYCVGALTGFLAASRRSRALVVAACFCATVGAVGMAGSSHLAVFAMAAIISSAGAGLASPALVDVLQRNVATSSVNRAQTTANAGTGPGVIAAGLIALLLLPDWRSAWVAAAIATAVAAASVLLLDRRRQKPSRDPRHIPSVRWLGAHRPVIAAGLLLGVGSAAVWNYGRALMVESGAPPLATMLAWIAIGAGGFAVVASARWTDSLRPGSAWLITVATAASASGVLSMSAGVAPLALAACAMFGWGYTAGTGALIAWTSEIDERRAPTGTALLFVALVLGQAIGAAGLGVLIAQLGYPAAFLTAAVVIAAAATLGVHRSAALSDAR